MGRVPFPGYEVLAQLGTGLSGQVFKVREEASDRILALKAIRPDRIDASLAFAFRREFFNLQRLTHPNIVPVYDLAEGGGGRLYFTMEYLRPVSLRRLYRRKGLKSFCRIMTQVCRALDFSHRQGLLHGDIRPENILVRRSGSEQELVLTDFGLARSLAHEKQEVVGGTIAYFAPEFLMGWPVDERSDLFSLGVLLYQAVAGRLPFPAQDIPTYQRALLDGSPTLLQEEEPDVSPGLGSLVDSLLARDPARRPSSALETYRSLAAEGGLKPDDLLPHRYLPARSPLLVGREEAMESLRTHYRKAIEGQGRVVLIQGPAGVGKSRLLEELMREMSAAGQISLNAVAPEVDHGGAFGLLRRVRRGGELIDLLTAVPKRSERNEGSGVAIVSEIDPGARGRLHEGFARAIFEGSEGEGSRKARLLVFDQLERCDDDTVRFLRYLSRLVEEKGVLCCLAARDARELADRLDLNPPRNEIQLEPLTREDTGQFVELMLSPDVERMSTDRQAVHPVLHPLSEWLYARVGGIPELLERMLHQLYRKDLLLAERSGWRLEEGLMEGLPLPPGLRRQAAKATAMLPPLEETLLREAALIGSTFDASLLQDEVKQGDPGVADRLHELVEMGFLTPDARNPSSYRFRRMDMWRSVIDEMPRRERRQLSERLVRRLESGNRRMEAAEFARLCREAGRRGEAAEAYSRAARAAWDSQGLREAARYYEEAWRALPASLRARELDLVAEWAEVLVTDGDLSRAIEVADTGLRVSGNGRKREEVHRRLLLLKGRAQRKAGDHGSARQTLRALTEPSRRLSTLRPEALTELGYAELVEGKHDEARALLTEARRSAHRRGRPAVAALAELRLGILAWRHPDFAEALGWYEKCRHTLVSVGEVSLYSAVLENMGLCQWNLLELSKARELISEAVFRNEKWHARSGAAHSCLNLAGLLLDMGEWESAERTLHRAEEWLRPLEGIRSRVFLLFWRAKLALLRGNISQATQTVREMKSLAADLNDPFARRGFLAVEAEVELARGDLEQAEKHAQRGVRLSRRADDRWNEVENRLIAALVGLRRGRSDMVRELEDLVELAEGVAPAREAFRARLTLALASARAGAGRQVDELLSRCAMAAGRVASPLWDGELGLCTGMVALERGNYEEACRSLAAADAQFVSLGARLHHLETLRGLSQARWAIGQRRAGIKAAHSARRLAEAIGVTAEVAPPGLPSDLRDEEKAATPDRWREGLVAMGRILTELTVLKELPAVLSSVLDIAISYMGAERGVIALVEPDSGEPRIAAGRNVARENLEDVEEVSRSVLRQAGSAGCGLYCGDALADPELGRRESVRRSRTRTLLCEPIIYHRRVLGTIYVDHREIPGLFGEEELLFFRLFASVAAVAIRNAERFALRDSQVRKLRGAIENKLVAEDTVARSSAMQKVLTRIQRAAESSVDVLLLGETGVGKDHLARLLHDWSESTGPFVISNPSTAPAGLAETHLFGIAERAATGVMGRKGVLEEADGGTVLLNEIGDLSPDLQLKLLGFFDSRVVPVVGLGSRAGGKRVRTRVICATNANLREMVRNGTFRKDLFHRVSTVTIEVPPLRFRKEDIPELAELFLARASVEANREGLVLSPEAGRLLQRCRWEGNVRELENSIRRAVAMVQGEIVGPEDLHSPSLDELRETERDPRFSPLTDDDRPKFLRLRQALQANGGIMSAAARDLGLSEGAVRKQVKKFGLEHLALRSRSQRRGR